MSILTIPNHTIKLQLHAIIPKKFIKKIKIVYSVLIRGTCRVATEGGSPLKGIPIEPDLFTLRRGLRKFFAASSTTMESLPLKELDFGLQKRTGPSSCVVASIVLVSPDWTAQELVWLKFVLLV